MVVSVLPPHLRNAPNITPNKTIPTFTKNSAARLILPPLHNACFILYKNRILFVVITTVETDKLNYSNDLNAGHP